MKFQYPQFLFALFVLSIPVIVHLFNFRRFKRVLFTNVRFLQEIKQDTRQRSQLKHLLVLISRLAAFAFLVFAFAQPYIPSEKGTSRASRNAVSFWIDNSFSMNASGKYGPLLDVARERAREVALSYQPSDRFQLLTNDFEGRHQRFVNREEFLQLLDEVRPTSAVRTLDEIIRRQEDAFGASPGSDGEQRSSFLLSDFQSTLLDAPLSLTDSTIAFYVLPFAAQEQNNIYIDTCYLKNPFVQPGSTQELTVRIKNSGNEDVEDVPVKLSVNGGQKALATVSLPAGGSVETLLPFTVSASGFQQAIVSLTDYPVTFDDTFYFSFHVRPDVRVTCIHGGSPNTYLQALYGNDAYFSYREFGESQVDYNALSLSQLVVLDRLELYASGLQQEVLRYMQNGGNVMVLPSEGSSGEGFRGFATTAGLPQLSGPVAANQKIGKLETSHPLLTGIFEQGKSVPDNMDLPVVLKTFTQTFTAKSGTQPLLRLEDGSPFLTYTPVGKGGCFLLSSPLDPVWTGLQQHALFVPLFIKAVLLGASEIGPGKTTGVYSEFTPGDTALSGDQVFHLSNPSTGFDAITDTRRNAGGSLLSVRDQVKTAGNYQVTAGANTVNVVSFNYDRKESDLRTMDPSDIEKVFTATAAAPPALLDTEDPSVAHSLSRLREGVSLWKYCIILVLLFLAIEVLLIRYFKKNAVSS
jgi:hypothetical protein